MRLKSSESALRNISRDPHLDDRPHDPDGDAQGAYQGGGELERWAELDPHLVAALSPTDPLGQAARNLRAMIAAARLEDGHRPKIVVLIGADADPETALLSASVAIASAQSGWRTLLVDSDATDPVQHRLFGIAHGAGAARGGNGEEPTLLVRPGPMAALALASTELSGSKLEPMQMHSALRDFVDEFDLIIVDASHSASSSAATFGADAAVVVLRRDFTAVSDTQEIVHSLRTAGTAVLGTFMFK
ncbi:hypothetical protein C1T17_12660 [Sphingobium sp. SCG-1]|uniref:hypothetical protein n=1 Tax=Sphingobium sp. SCG-1 TaxID=2072936 RepID=UPI000CD6A76E|nr:hypothetical protein [Sphingobium sp. SCG-1]AUW58813.1 hypothetical protein C1T17_12660 [Sphingobium sp. SCG-1]